MNNKSNYNKIIEQMQNRTQYSSANPFNNVHHPVSAKFNSQNSTKVIDQGQGTNSLTQLSNHPNLNFEFTNPKPTHQVNSDRTNVVPSSYNQNIEFRNQHNPMNYGFNSNNQKVGRPQRGNQMSKSTIISDSDRNEPIFEDPQFKKQLFKNVPKRTARMSETLLDFPNNMNNMGQRKEDNPLSVKQINFYKNKDIERGYISKEKQKQSVRQVPSFLNRGGNQLKKSMMVQPTFEQNKNQFQPKDIPKLPKKKVSINDFVKMKQLGKGKYGQVYLAQQKSTNFICALKIIEKKLLHEEQITDQFIREVKIQMFLNHPNIIKMYGCFDDATNIYIILEVGTGGQLYHQLKKSQPLSQPRIAFIMKQVCDAVNQIHNLKVIHRDIKPQNIVLHDNIIKLCDFGWSVYQDNKLRTTFCGTPLYVCPEILKGNQYDEKIDIWSIGIMMYEMVVGENPFKITREQQLIKIVKDEIKIPSYISVSAEVRDFLDRCLQKNPHDRASMKQLMIHPFFKKNQQKNDKSKVITM